ncbi:MAG: HEPN domain-containing protein [Proteobacteria bacterium]|nr:HEPN domain-containing protein [Pseudomonadota bacterium]
MKRSLAHLPKRKKDELKRVVGIVREMVPSVEMMILFGSHARGDWVEDRYRQGGVEYEYKSDFDILVVTEDKKTARNDALWDRLDQRITRVATDQTPVNLIAHHIQELNARIEEGSYFFTDIKKEGAWLYNSGKYRLARARRLNAEERKAQAERDFKLWFKKAQHFYDDCETNLKKRRHNQAAFMLHQATEHAYTAVLLTFTGYKPKTHNIAALGRRAASHDPGFAKVFPRKTKDEQRLFKLLKKAYVDARYSDKYRISKKDLEYLSARVKKLHGLVRRVCKARIAGFGQG